MSDNGNNTQPPLLNRDRLALFVSTISISGIVAICITIFIVFYGKDGFADKAMTIFSTVVALAGSWIGTILAFYFGKENFESAQKSLTTLVSKMTPQEKLKSISIKSKMIPKEKMFLVKLPAEKIKLQETITELEKTKLGNRIPVLTDNDFPYLVVHRSIVIEYFYERKKEEPEVDLATLTLADLLNVEKWKKYLENKIAVVREDGTLADAKAILEENPGCQDVFVTKGGTKAEVVTGWITNEIISENAVV